MANIVTFEFPIKGLGVAQMHNISPSALSKFHGFENEGQDTFLFEFELICRGYHYCTNSQSLQAFTLILKGETLQWFMSLGGNYIRTWEDMKNLFLEKYQDYGQAGEDIFGIKQEENESFEDYVGRF